MRITQVIKFYKKQALAADAIGVSPQLMSKLKKSRRPIPLDYQIAWEVDSDGQLRADLPKQIRRQPCMPTHP